MENIEQNLGESEKNDQEPKKEPKKVSKKETENEPEPEKEEIPEITPEEYMHQKVTFYGFFDGERYKDDIIVTVNGKAWQIRRGVNVEIPRYVYEEVMSAERQKMEAFRTSTNFEEQYQKLASRSIL